METILVLQTASLASKRRLNLNGISRGADELGWRVQTIDKQPTQRQLDELIDLWQPRGIVIEGSCGTTTLRTPSSIPTVFLDCDPSRTHPHVCCIRNDSAEFGTLIASELLSLGLRHFAFVAWHKPVYWCTEKREAFAKILRLHGAEPQVFQPSRNEPLGSVSLQRRLRDWLKTLPKPCGIFAITDATAEQVLAAALAEGLEVPGELAVIGIDNDETICERTHPTLTSVMPNFDATGHAAVMALAEGRTSAKRQTIGPFGLIRRQSTRLIARTDSCVNAALERIRREACNGLTAADVLKIFPCSRRLAERRFRTVAGTTILSAIHQVRLCQARILLSDPRLPIKDIALRCGWNSDIVFRRIYKEAYGHTPRFSQRPSLH